MSAMKLSAICIGIIVAMLVVPATAETRPVQQDFTKSVMLNYHINKGDITFLDAKVFYGHSRNLFDLQDTFTGSLIGQNDIQIQKFGLSDPRLTFLHKGSIQKDNVNFSVIIPYSKDLTALGISDTKNGTELIRTDLRQLKADFCKSHPNDPDCGFQITPIVLIAGALVAVCVIASGWYILKKKKAAQK